MRTRTPLVVGLVALPLSIYLFASAPPPLETTRSGGNPIPVETMFDVLAYENDVVRTLYTREIVGAGMEAGLAFDEDWREEGVEAGPLPALYLRAAARELEISPIPLSLFLGSDYPISPANAFQGIQTERFATMKRQDSAPQFFYDEDTERHTGMFVDLAIGPACIDCHNQHVNSPKTDWVLGDVMGATTWLYPDDTLTYDQLMIIISAFRDGARTVYSEYIQKARTFAAPPEIGESWPREGPYLPTPDVFMEEYERRAAKRTLGTLLSLEPEAGDGTP